MRIISIEAEYVWKIYFYAYLYIYFGLQAYTVEQQWDVQYKTRIDNYLNIKLLTYDFLRSIKQLILHDWLVFFNNKYICTRMYDDFWVCPTAKRLDRFWAEFEHRQLDVYKNIQNVQQLYQSCLPYIFKHYL